MYLPRKFSTYFERKLRLCFKVSKLAERLHAAPNDYYFCIAKTHLLISFPALSKRLICLSHRLALNLKLLIERF
jgi:hypothetical protein